MKHSIPFRVLVLLTGASLLLPMSAPVWGQAKVEFVPVPAQSTGKLGEVLPIPRPVYQPTTEPDWRKVAPPPRFEVKPPKGAPNVVIVLMDQAGYADPTGMGGPINTPTFDRLAQEGLKYVNFHVNPLCSPTRAALLTGRNAHQNSMAGVAGTASAYPGDTSIRPQTITTIGTVLQAGAIRPGISGSATRYPSTRSTSAGRSISGRRGSASTSSTATLPGSNPCSIRVSSTGPPSSGGLGTRTTTSTRT